MCLIVKTVKMTTSDDNNNTNESSSSSSSSSSSATPGNNNNVCSSTTPHLGSGGRVATPNGFLLSDFPQGHPHAPPHSHAPSQHHSSGPHAHHHHHHASGGIWDLANSAELAAGYDLAAGSGNNLNLFIQV